MPSGAEIVLGFTTWNDSKAVMGNMGLKYDKDERDFSDSCAVQLNRINGLLKDIHRQCLVDAGFTVIGTTRNGYIEATTPAGKREFAPFAIEVIYDPDEMGDEEPRLGIAISGRYFPTFADWYDGSGALYNARGIEKSMAIARKRILEYFSEFAQAEYMIVERWY